MSDRPEDYIRRMDILAEVLDRVRLGGTLLFHFELGHPWNLELPERPYALFHYLSRGSARPRFCSKQAKRELHGLRPVLDTRPRPRFRSCSIDITAYRLPLPNTSPL